MAPVALLRSTALGLLAAAPLAGGAPPTGEVLYGRLTDSVWQIWLRDLASGADTQVTFTEGDKRWPGWTPAGEVYYHTITQGCFVVRRGTNGDAQHEPVLAELWPVRDLAWSPDGKRIAFSRIRTDIVDAANLCVSAGGPSATWLTQEGGIQYNPSWSPDGARIAFVSGNGWGTYEIESIGADGADRRRLTENGNHEFLPTWSPDGRSLAFVSDRSGNYDVWTMAGDGADPRRLTDHPGLDTGPCWSPDGREVAYTSARAGAVQVWCVPAEGGAPRALVETAGGARDPAWRAAPTPAVPPGEPLLLSEIGAHPKTLRRGRDAEVELRFRLSHPASVSVDVVDEAGHARRRLAARDLAAGAHALRWDGADAAGEPVPDGVYRYVLTAEHADGRRARHDPSTEPWGERMEPTEFTLDDATGRMRWIQPRAGLARLRTAVQGFPLLGTLLDWAPLEGGEQTLDWNGLDASGEVELGAYPARWITLELIELPRNTIFVAGGTLAPASVPGREAEYPPMLASGERSHLEARKPRSQALAPAIALEFPGAELDPADLPLVRGVVPVRVTIAPEHVASMVDALFEVAFYVDLTFFFEDEESTTPMTWMWDTSDLPPGPHLLTVNVFSYDGRIGCLTRSVVVEPAR